MSPSPLESQSPQTYREENPSKPPPPEYKAPSVLAEYKGLAILFAVGAIGFGIYCLRPHAPRAGAKNPVAAQPRAPAPAASQAPMQPKAPPATQPIYIEAIPDKDSR